MKLSKRIEAAELELVSFKDKLVEQEKMLDSEVEGEADAAISAIEELSSQIDTETKGLDVLKHAEKALASTATPATGPGSSAAGPGAAGMPVQKSAADLLVQSAVCTMEAYLKRVPVEQIIESRYSGNEHVKAVTGITTKAAQNPAMTTVAGWAQELTRESYAAFLDLLKADAIIPQLPLTRHEFDGFAAINIPMRSGSRATAPNLAASFRAEGDPIRVGSVSLATKKLTPKSMGIIGTFTMELFERSTPNIEQAIRQWMIDDTAEVLDSVFLGSGAASTTTPAGLQTYATGANTAASGGATAALITADLRGRLQAFANARMGRRPVWIMNPARAWGLSLSLTAAGTPSFPEMASGVLLNVPVVTSVNVPADVVFLVDAAEISFAGGAPKFMGTETATIHEEALQSAVSPIVSEAAAGGAAIGDVANPVRSLFQTNSSALRTIWELDWAVTRDAGSIQTLTAVGW